MKNEIGGLLRISYNTLTVNTLDFTTILIPY